MTQGVKSIVKIFDDVTLQQCRECEEWKPLNTEFFAIRNASWTGFNQRCKMCVNFNQQAHRAANPEQYQKEKEVAREYAHAKYAADPEAGRDQARLWRENNPEKHAMIEKRSQQKRVRAFERYGVSQEQYDIMLTAQGGVCAIEGCNRTNKNKRMDVDHDHSCCPGSRSCGKCVRGLVCGSCNKAMGLLRDDPAIATGLADYLITGGFKYAVSD